jgi:MFS family permease
MEPLRPRAARRPAPAPERLPALARWAPGVFYGWWVAGGACLISLVCAGMGFYTQGVLLDALCREHGWARATVAGATSSYFMVSGVAGLAVGRGVDRFGPRGFIAAGAVLLALSLAAIGRVDSQAMLYLWFPVMAVSVALAGPVPTSTIVTRWFLTLRARAMTLSQTGVSIGGILIVPLSTYLIRTRGLGFATEVLGALAVGVALPVTLFVLRADPAPHGWQVDGPQSDSVRAARAEPAFRTRQALRTRAFWGLLLAFGLGLFAQVGFLAHQLAFLRERLAAADAAFTVSTTAFGSVIGRFAIGPLGDRLEKRRITLGLFLVQALATFAFSHATGGLALGAASFVFGLTMGNIFMMQPLLVGEFFGSAAFASVLGSLQLGTSLASGLGPVVVGLAFDRLGGYRVPFETLSLVAIAAALVLSRVRPPTHPV